MKTSIVLAGCILALGAVAPMPFSAVFAADTNAQGVATAEPARLPYGVDDVLKLSRAQISEDIILNYVQSSGTVYSLAPQDIVYLHNQGVSDRVVNAMLDQRKRLAEAAPQAIVQASPATPAPTYPTTPTATDAATVNPEPAPTYFQPAPAASSLYVIPYPAGTAAYYGYYQPYPYYGGPYYGGYYGPAISFGFRFGGGWGHYGGHGFYGGHHGGFYGHRR